MPRLPREAIRFGSHGAGRAVDTFLTLYQGLRLQRVDIFVTDAELASGRTSLDVEDLVRMHTCSRAQRATIYRGFAGDAEGDDVDPFEEGGIWGGLILLLRAKKMFNLCGSRVDE